MIFDLLTDGQWFVVWTVVLIGFCTTWPIVVSNTTTRDEIPAPVAFGILLGAASTLLVALVLGLIHGLTWMWVYG